MGHDLTACCKGALSAPAARTMEPRRGHVSGYLKTYLIRMDGAGAHRVRPEKAIDKDCLVGVLSTPLHFQLSSGDNSRSVGGAGVSCQLSFRGHDLIDIV